MAESIYTILTNGKTITAVKGEGDYNMTLPETMPTADQFMNENLLLKWAQDNDVLHSCLQKGVQKHLIDLRARFRQVKKDESWNHADAQKNVDTAEWGVVMPPSSNKVDKAREQGHIAAGIAMAKAMRDNGLDDATILAALTPVYGSEVSEAIMADLDS